MLWRAACELGWDVERLSSWRVTDVLRSIKEPVFYVEGLMGPLIAKELGVRLEYPPADWLPTLPFEYRKREITLTTLGSARQLDERAFFKPAAEKSFPAAASRGHDLPSEFDESMPILAAEIVDWMFEFRCFVLDRSLETISIYMRDGEIQRENGFEATLSELQEAEGFIRTLLADSRIRLPKATVIDIGVIRGKGWAVVEQNPAWGAGLYGCNPIAVLKVLRHAGNKDRDDR